jgi:SPW repeat
MTTDDPRGQVRIVSGINTLLGALLVIAPWLFHYAAWQLAATCNSVIAGAAIMTCALLRVIHPGSSSGFAVANIAIGFWTLMTSSLFGQATTTAGWLTLGVGAVVMALATWGANVIIGPTHRRHA